ncbi:carbohydrate porin [Alistipes sp. ZOR0009]|uniref:carbohydrate porin n=1 Tax=Alistipes sp. ZOR0009 TaxID=1339253 RepID=UPI0009DFBECF|nr:carbohydrate porin [Alistipes sp. ZOR0009]
MGKLNQCVADMKHYAPIVLLLALCNSLWGQADSGSKNASPFTYSILYKGDWVSSFKGGVKSGSSYAGIATAHLAFDLEKARWWKGGLLQVYLSNTHGQQPSERLVGAYQAVSNIEAGNRTFFQEFWFEQTVGQLSLKLGIQDLNVEFSANDFGSSFINSSFGIQSTFNDNLPASIFPVTGFGGILKWSISAMHTAKIGLFEGNPSCLSIDPWVFRIPFFEKSGTLNIFEYSYSGAIPVGANGFYKLGMYYHNHTSPAQAADTNHAGHNYGFYFVGNQPLYRRSDHSSLNLFTQLSLSPIKQSSNHLYWGVGLSYKGPSWHVPDELGLAFAQARFNESNAPLESVWECFYRYSFGQYFYLQPSAQYIVNPMRFGYPLNDAFLAIVRFGFHFEPR